MKLKIGLESQEFFKKGGKKGHKQEYYRPVEVS